MAAGHDLHQSHLALHPHALPDHRTHQIFRLALADVSRLPGALGALMKNKKWIAYGSAVLVSLCVICAVAALAIETPDPGTATPTAQTLAVAPIDELRLQIEASLGNGNRDIARLTAFDWSETDQTLIIKWAINDNLSSHLIMVGIQKDVTDMLNVISQSGLLPNYQFITFVGTFPLSDTFGNVAEERVVTASYDKTTVDKINWDGFQYPDVFAIADLVNIHPAMTSP